MAMRLLYHLPLSPFARKVRLVLAEKRLAFEMRVEKPWERRADYLALNPSGSVPTLVEETGLAIPDSGVICEYLEEAYPDIPLMGHTLAERVEIRRLVAWLDGKFTQEVNAQPLRREGGQAAVGHGTARRECVAGRVHQPQDAPGLYRLAGGKPEMAWRQCPPRWPTSPRQAICPRSISAATWTGRRFRRHMTGMPA